MKLGNFTLTTRFVESTDDRPMVQALITDKNSGVTESFFIAPVEEAYRWFNDSRALCLTVAPWLDSDYIPDGWENEGGTDAT